MELNELKENMLNATKEEQEKIVEIQNDDLWDNIRGTATLYDDIKDAIRNWVDIDRYTYQNYYIKGSSHSNRFVCMVSDSNVSVFDWKNFVFHMIDEIFKHDLEPEVREKIEQIFDTEKKAIKQQIKFIKNVMEEINNIDKKTNDKIWDLGPIETAFKVYEVLEKECQRIIYQLNIDFDMSEYHITKSVPKAIKLIEEKLKE